MGKRILPMHLGWYAVKEFQWDQLSFGTFYQIMYPVMKEFAYRKRYVNGRKNFEDIFQDAMLNFYLYKKRHPEKHETNEEAAGMVKRMFFFAMVDDFRKNKWIILQDSFPDSFGSTGGYDSLFISIPLNKRIQMFFAAVDKKIEESTALLKGRQLEFYELYKTTALHPFSDQDTKAFIMQKMNITAGYFRVLKTEVKAVLSVLIQKMNIVISTK